MKQITPIQINWKPDKNSTMPVYKQIVKFICSKISNGDWIVGTRLPSQRTLAEFFNVNRSTITSAIDELASYGIIKGCHGAGTQVVSNTWSLKLSSSPAFNNYVFSGFFKSNSKTIQEINRLEFEEGIIRLGTGELDPRLFPHDMWNNVLKELGNDVQQLGYLEPLGMLELREAISDHMKTLGICASVSSILITSGSLQALQLISSCLLKNGSKVFIESPSYIKSLQMFQSVGMNLTGIPMDKDGIEFWKISSMLKSQHTGADSILYTIPTNHNPTGILMSDDRRSDLIDFCIKNRLPIIEDGAYQELCYNNKTHFPIKKYDKDGIVIYLGSASKSLAPGLRIGWVIAPEPIIQRLGDVKMQIDYGASSISQLIFAKFLSTGLYDKYLNELKKELCHRRDNALSVLDKNFSEIANWIKPSGGFYIWLTFKNKININKLFKLAVKNHILLNPGDIYDFRNNNSLRLSYAYTSCEEFEAAIKKLSEIIQTAF